MSCRSCQENKTRPISFGPVDVKESEIKATPINVTDIVVYDGEEIRELSDDDWKKNRHKLLLFYPHTFTPVCTSEMGAINDWIDEFDKLNCDVFSITSDSIEEVKAWYDTEHNLHGLRYKALSSILLPIRLGIFSNGSSKRASVFMTSDGETIVQEHFDKVGRSLKELHRTMYAYNTGSYCAADWQDPSDGFLK